MYVIHATYSELDKKQLGTVRNGEIPAIEHVDGLGATSLLDFTRSEVVQLMMLLVRSLGILRSRVKIYDLKD